MKKTILVFLLAAIGCHSHAQTEDSSKVKVVKYPANYTGDLNVVYAKLGDWDGRMDVYYAPKDAKPLPVVINIHGGGWNHGNKESQGGFASWFKLGFAVANVEYRLTPQATAPAAIEDVRCAMLYLVKHAKELNIDPNRIVFAGTSAGAHLALLAGLLQNNHHFDTNCLGIDGFKVVAIIDQYGIADVWDWAYGPNIRSKSATNWLGARAKDEAFAASLSPISYVTKASPPTLIVHGDADPVVPYQESVALYKKYQDAGVVSQFITVSGGKHGGFDKEKKEEIVNAIAQFLKGLKVIE